jgi:hypothetical protein
MNKYLSAKQSDYTKTDLLNYTNIKQDNSIVRQDYEYDWDSGWKGAIIGTISGGIEESIDALNYTNPVTNKILILKS